MQVGFIGAGNMARALARGWGDPVLCTDGGSGRAQALADELGGEALHSNRELAQRADVLVLAHKPAQLEQVAEQVGGDAQAVISVLAATPLRALEAAFPGVPVFRTMPNTAVEIRRGVICLAEVPGVESELEASIRALLERVGRVVVLPEKLMDVATATMGVWPAYVALIIEAQVDASVRAGMKPELAAELVTAAIEGSAALVAENDYDTLAVRRGVTSPGGMTARGLDALEHAGLRAAFTRALDAALGSGAR
jgi:pyrroline-5-carboxylate reductase